MYISVQYGTIWDMVHAVGTYVPTHIQCIGHGGWSTELADKRGRCPVSSNLLLIHSLVPGPSMYIVQVGILRRYPCKSPSINIYLYVHIQYA